MSQNTGLRAFMRLVSQSIFDVWMHLRGITFSCISTFLEASMQYLSTKRSKPWHFRDSENPQIEQNELAREVLEKMRSGPEFLRNDGFGTSLENGQVVLMNSKKLVVTVICLGIVIPPSECTSRDHGAIHEVFLNKLIIWFAQRMEAELSFGFVLQVICVWTVVTSCKWWVLTVSDSRTKHDTTVGKRNDPEWTVN